MVGEKAWWERMKMLEIFAYRTVAVVHFTDQNWISKTVYCIRSVMVCKIGFTNWNSKIALLRASMVVTYYIKLSRTEADRRNGTLMSLLLLVAETIIKDYQYSSEAGARSCCAKKFLKLRKIRKKTYMPELYF